MLGRQARPAGDGGLLDGIEAMSLPLKWIAVGAPGDRHGAMITRQLEGEDAGATAVRVALTLFPDELIITLRIMGWPIPDTILIPDGMKFGRASGRERGCQYV